MPNRKPRRKDASLTMINFRADTIEDENGCLNWKWGTASIEYPYGYPSIWTKQGYKYGHRLAWELRHGIIPEGKWVLHNCFNKICLNVTHFRLGDNVENKQDSDFAKLSREDVVEIKKLLQDGSMLQKEIAVKYQISEAQISRIKQGKKWSNIEV